MSSTGIAREESVKREVNEAIESGLWPDERDEIVRMRCECGSHECIAFIDVHVAEYEDVRRHPRRFCIASGHQIPEVEAVVGRTPRYIVVEKTGGAGEVAERSDPRS